MVIDEKRNSMKNATFFNVDGMRYAITSSANKTCKVSRANLELVGEVVLPDMVEYDGQMYAVTGIECGAFKNQRGLTGLVLPKGVRRIGSSAFAGCIALMRMVIPEGVNGVRWHTFFGCSSLKEVILPEGLMAIENEAFDDCCMLKSLTIPSSVVYIGERVFSGCCNLEHFSVAEGNVHFDSRNDCQAIISTQSNSLLYGCSKTVIPQDVTIIRSNAFCSCGLLEHIMIPDGVYTIDACAFSYCHNLKKVSIPSTVSSIGNWTFENCSSLTALSYEGTKAQWEMVIKGRGWNASVPASCIQCTDGPADLPDPHDWIGFSLRARW